MIGRQMKQCIPWDLGVSIWVFRLQRTMAVLCEKKKLIISPTVTEQWDGERKKRERWWWWWWCGGIDGRGERLAHLVLSPSTVWESLIICWFFFDFFFHLFYQFHNFIKPLWSDWSLIMNLILFFFFLSLTPVGSIVWYCPLHYLSFFLSLFFKRGNN